MKQKPKCWQDRLSTLEYGSEEWLELFMSGSGETCLLPSDHSEPHQWTPDSEIVIQFTGGGDE